MSGISTFMTMTFREQNLCTFY